MKLILLSTFCVLLFVNCQGQNINIYKKDIAGIKLEMPLNQAMLLANKAIGFENPAGMNTDSPNLDANKLAPLLEQQGRNKYTTFNNSLDRAEFDLRNDNIKITIKGVKTGNGNECKIYEVTYKIQDDGNVETAKNMGKKSLEKFGKPSYGQELNGRYYYGWCQEMNDNGSCKIKTASIRISSQELIMQDLGLFQKYFDILNKKNAQDAKF